MSSAPPGWHRQPDGRERFWDGERWTDEFREPSSSPTEQIPIGETQSMPQAQAQSESGYAGAGSGGYAPPPAGGHYQDYPRDPYYGQGGPPPSGGTPGWLKGCLVALLVIVLLGALVVGAGWWLFNRAVDTVTEPGSTSTQTVAPTDEVTDEATEEPTDDSTAGPELPTDSPAPSPTDIPTAPGVGITVEVSIGEGFTFGPAEVQEGWSITEEAFGFKTVSMTVIPLEATDVPLLFTMRFLSGSEELGSTGCTVGLGTAGAEHHAVCVPMRGEPQDADVVEISGLEER